jgi:hypothetical protein
MENTTEESVQLAQRKEYFTALVACIGELENVAKTANNPYFKSKYAPLDAIVEYTRPILKKHKLAIKQDPVFRDGCAGVITSIIHTNGWVTSSELVLPLKDQTPQGVGSAITYARRYALAAVLGLATEDDDDGNISTGLTKKEEPRHPIAKVMDKKDDSPRPAPSATTVWRGVKITDGKIAAKSKDGSPKKWVLYSFTFDEKNEALSFDEKLWNIASDASDTTLFDAHVAPNKKDPSKWELVQLSSTDDKD